MTQIQIEAAMAVLEGRIEAAISIAAKSKNNVELESRIDDLCCDLLALEEQLDNNR